MSLSISLSSIYLIFHWVNGILHVLFYNILFPSVSFGHNVFINFIYKDCIAFHYDLPSFIWATYPIYNLFPNFSIISMTMRNILDFFFFTFRHLCDYFQGFISWSGNGSLSELWIFGIQRNKPLLLMAVRHFRSLKPSPPVAMSWWPYCSSHWDANAFSSKSVEAWIEILALTLSIFVIWIVTEIVNFLLS